MELLRDAAEVLSVKRFPKAVGSLGQLVFGHPALVEGDFFQASNHQTLTGLNGMDERRRIQKRLGCPRVEPSRPAAELFRAQRSFI